MKKIKTLFKKSPYHLGRITNQMRPEISEWIKDSQAYIKRDGTSTMIKDGVIHIRFDYKEGRKLPNGAIPCQSEADKKSGHFPHWVPVTEENKNQGVNPELLEVFNSGDYENGTYEFCGIKIQGNPENINGYKLFKHDSEPVEVTDYSYEGLLELLTNLGQEGIVFHRNGSEEKVKLRLSDYGIDWKIKEPHFGRFLSWVNPKHYNELYDKFEPKFDLINEAGFYFNVEDYLDFSKWLDKRGFDYTVHIETENKIYKNITRNKKRKVVLIDFDDKVIPFKSINPNEFEIGLIVYDTKLAKFIYQVIFNNKGY